MHYTISNEIEVLKLRNRFPQDPGSLPHSNGLRADHRKVEASKQFAIRPMLIRGLRRGGRPTLDITRPRASNLTKLPLIFILTLLSVVDICPLSVVTGVVTFE